MLSKGTVLLRNAVPDDVISPIAEEVERMLDHFDEIPADVIRREMDSEDSYRRSVWSQILSDGVHYNYDFVVFSKGRHSLYDPVRKSLLYRLIAEGWPQQKIVENPITNVRRVFAGDATGYADKPLSAHVDAMFHQHDTLGINFWLPLTTAGTDRPGIAVVPLGVEETKQYLEFNPKGYEQRDGDFGSMRHFRSEKLAADKLQRAGLHFAMPHMKPGDALAFTNFTIHATHVTEAMTHPRTSIEGRMLIEP
jgi:hypothetical protein